MKKKKLLKSFLIICLLCQLEGGQTIEPQGLFNEENNIWDEWNLSYYDWGIRLGLCAFMGVSYLYFSYPLRHLELVYP